MNKTQSKMNSIIIAPKFFNFDSEIFNRIKDVSDSCILLSEKPSFDFELIQLALQKLPRETYSLVFDKYVSKILTPNPYISSVILIRGEHWRTSHLKKLKNAYPNATFFLYQWDSVDNLPNFLEQIPYFDKVFTFNPDDSVNFKIEFKPLFYKKNWRNRAADNSLIAKKYKVAFVGSDYDDRYEVIKKFKHINNISDNKFFCHLYRSRYSYIYNKYFKNGGNLNGTSYDYQSTPLSEERMLDAFLSSDSILDINPKYQVGLSARTFEALALNKKLITTNKRIVEYDFYDPRNIYVIERDNLYVPKEFIEGPYFPLCSDILNKYSSINWVKDFVL